MSSPYDPPPPLRDALRDAVEDDDPLTTHYVDRKTSRVVAVRDGLADDPLLDADDIEDDDQRFLEAPIVLPSTDHLWRIEFLDELDDPKIARVLDHKKGAGKRFVQRLAKRDPDLVARWRTFRLSRIDELVGEFLAAQGLGDGAID